MTNQKILKVLLLYTPLEDYTRLKDILLELPEHYQVDIRINSPEITAKLRNIDFDLLILFTSAKEKNELAWIKDFSTEFLHKPIVVITPNEDLDFATQMLQWGAQDYHVLGDIEPSDLVRSFQFSVERSLMLVDLGKHIQERFQHLIEKNLDSMMIIDAKGIIQYLNSAASKLFDSSQEYLVGQRFKYASEIDGSEIDIPRRDGRTCQGELRFIPIEWSQKDCRLAIIRDLTNFSTLEKLKVELSEYERLSKLKDQFIGTVSHELRTPLTIIRGAVGNMIDGVIGELSDEQKRVAKIADNNVTRLTRIIDNLLDLSRLESEKVHINPGQINVQRFMNNIVQSFQILAEEKDIKLTLDISENQETLYADPDMIAQVMNNLISNALRYAKSRIAIHLDHVQEKLENQNEESWLQVSVEDDGPGLPEEEFENLFSKFVQHNRPQGGAGYKGTGLGLAICKAIIDQHRGKIWIESELDKGSAFKFKLTHYNEARIFESTLQEGIRESDIMNTGLCVLVIFVNNHDKIKQKCFNPEIESMFTDIENKLRNKVLRQSDKVTYFVERGLILIQAMTDRNSGALIEESIPELTADILCEGVQGNIKPQLSVGMSMYPTDGKAPRDLLNEAYKSSQVKKVMLVDEQHSLLNIMSLLLKTKDFMVEMAVDGQTGLDLACNFKPDVILLDINMPDMDGWEVCRKIRELPNTKDVPLIIMANDEDSEMKKNLKELNAKLLSKPYHQNDLLDLLKSESMSNQKDFEF